MLVGTLSVAKFGDKPQFEALSYTWGTSQDKKRMMLNGHQFSIGKNLSDALVFLRNQKRPLLLWVDAICINQDDTPERNAQVQIMQHIYMRAKNVLVWLGRDFQVDPDIFGSLPKQQTQTPTDNDGEGSSHPLQDPVFLTMFGVSGARQKELAKRLYKSEYWQRLWIIQEIVHAYQLVVCFGSSTLLDWETFMRFVMKHEICQDGPVRLYRLREEVAAGSSTLQAVLFKHGDAICAEPRDKIYGLKGLAADADDLPMDYGKSLMEVWRNVMMFVNKKKTPAETDIMSFGALVKHLLMGDDSTPLQSVLRPQGAAVSKSMHVGASKSPNTFHMDGFVIGKIQFVGPSTADIDADVESVNTWRRKVQDHFHRDIQSATRESNTLLSALLQLRQTRSCFNHASPTQWQIRSRSSSRSVDSVHHQNTPETGCVLANEGVAWRMGIASSQAEQGDLVVWVSGIRLAIVVRIHRNGISKQGHAHLQVVGSAWMTEDVARSKVIHEKRCKSFDPEDCLSLQMDATTIFVLVAQDDV
ncbi:hypothetical protein PG989_010363 [Apiospora arundinis]